MTSLVSIVRSPDQIPRIADIVILTNKLVTRALLFLKILLLEYDVTVNRVLVDLVIKKVGLRSDNRKFGVNQGTWNILTQCYADHFAPLLPPNDKPLPLRNLRVVTGYVAERILTDYNTNIQQQYPQYVQDLVDRYYSKWVLLKDPTTDRAKLKEFLTQIGKDVLRVEKWKSKPIYHDDIRYLQQYCLPVDGILKYDLPKGKTAHCYKYDIKVRPDAYFKVMKFITQECSQDPDYRLRNCVPLRLSLIPKYIRFDTTAVIDLLLPKHVRITLTGTTIKEKREAVWSTLFHTDDKVFRKTGHQFDWQLETNGVGVSILFKKNGGNRASTVVALPIPDKYGKLEEPYVDKLLPPAKAVLARKTVVGNDPGMSDLLSFVSERSTSQNPQQLRYTQNQRRQETKTRKYADIFLREKNATVIDGLTVTEWETRLSICTLRGHKVMDIASYKLYLKEKLLLNSKLGSFYEDFIYRKLRFNTHINTQRSEQNLVNRFKKKFGTPDQVVIGYGDWSESHHRKYHEPVKGVGFRKLFRRAGYEVVLVDEYRTSHYCCSCKLPTSYCREEKSPPGSTSKVGWCHKVHGLLRCETCMKRWNRDINGAINIARVTRSELDGNGRPVYLQRGQWSPPRKPKKHLTVASSADTTHSSNNRNAQITEGSGHDLSWLIDPDCVSTHSHPLKGR